MPGKFMLIEFVSFYEKCAFERKEIFVKRLAK